MEPKDSEILPLVGDSGNWLFADGGVYQKNPSPVGGPYAWCLVADGEAITTGQGFVYPAQIGMPNVTNNNTELIALCTGILALPDDWRGTVASDSAIALGWVFSGFKIDKVPARLQPMLLNTRKRARNLRYLCLAGHPKPADLETGSRLSKAPHLPVSRFNVWCDTQCGLQNQQEAAAISQRLEQGK